MGKHMSVSTKSVKKDFFQKVIIAVVVALAVLIGTGYIGVSRNGYTSYPSNVHVETTTFHVGDRSWEVIEQTENETGDSSLVFQTAMRNS